MIVKDDKSRIIEKLNNFRKKYSFVFTSGGIGPTHDDITSDSVACALGKKLILNTEAKRRLEKHYADDVLTKARLKMAYMPENSTLIDNPVSVAPGFLIQNIFVFPGVPKIMQVMFKEKVKSIDEGLRYYKKTISTTLSEGIIGEYIEKIQNKFNTLEIGSNSEINNAISPIEISIPEEELKTFPIDFLEIPNSIKAEQVSNT